MMKYFFCVLMTFSFVIANAQDPDTIKQTSLQEVVVKAYEQVRRLREVPAAVNYVGRQALERFNSSSIVQAVNTTPGVRMEERSPGSYRFNIRGSALRSPFGVRNVKVYFNEIPFTEPGGNSYLNSLGYYNYGSIEILKGPGSSLYGAGTGGVMLIESADAAEPEGITAEYTTGTFGLRNIYASATNASDNTKNKIGFQHQQSEGYRNHSALERNIFSWNGRYKISETGSLKTTFLYSDLFYETPGALTKKEFDADPKTSRPAGGGFPSAEQSRASIQQKTFLAGVGYTQNLSSRFLNATTGYGMFTELRNPAIRNYGKNIDPHVGGRTVFTYNAEKSGNGLRMITGAEVQQSFSSVAAYKNKAGQPDSLQSLDDVPVRQTIVFLQTGYKNNGWEVAAGASLNFLKIVFRRSVPAPLPEQQRNFTNELAPRFSLAKTFKTITLYTSVAKGFSPPTTAELLPSGSNINLELEAERGVNYDVGVRGRWKDFSFDINAFFFSLQNTLAQRRDAGGGDFYVNAGRTAQRGIETSLTHPLFTNVAQIRQGLFWVSHTWHRFRYEDFKQLATDFSGKRLPGVAPHTLSTGIDLATAKGILFNVNYYYSDRIPLNDANNEYARPYHLLAARLGFEKMFRRQYRLRLTGGVENALDQAYSLGNDINAFGGRFYNAAPARSFYLSLALGFNTNRLIHQ